MRALYTPFKWIREGPHSLLRTRGSWMSELQCRSQLLVGIRLLYGHFSKIWSQLGLLFSDGP